MTRMTTPFGGPRRSAAHLLRLARFSIVKLASNGKLALPGRPSGGIY